jgi:hypothetical protein
MTARLPTTRPVHESLENRNAHGGVGTPQGPAGVVERHHRDRPTFKAIPEGPSQPGIVLSFESDRITWITHHLETS